MRGTAPLVGSAVVVRPSVDVLSRPAGDPDPPLSRTVYRADRRRTRWLVTGATALVSLPLVVALVGFRRPPWAPVLDLAMTELRVRDVGAAHTPLIGLPGRIGTIDQQGSHPGPLSFYALAPTYRLLGSTAWALQVATVVVHVVAIATSLWLAARRGGPRLVVAVAAVLAALTAGYGGGTLTEPWNPYLPLLWWVVLLLAVWSVLCDDLPMLPLVVLAASFCAQTHVPYLGLALGMGALAIGGALLHARRHPDQRGRALRWGVAAAGLGLLLWLPPTVDQIRHDPGNYRQLIDHFSDPTEAPVGMRVGVEVGLRYLDVAHLFRSDTAHPGWLVTSADGNLPSKFRGAGLLAAWAVSALVAVRRRHATLARLHAVVGLGVALMFFAISRIFGVVWYYLALWGWAVGLLALLATVWTAAVVVGDRWEPDRRERAGRTATLALGAVALAIVIRFTVAAPDSVHADPTVASELEAVADDVAAGLRSDEGAATGTDGRYLLTWSDAFHIGSQGYGLLNELERRGFDVSLEDGRRVPATNHRVLDPNQATARLHLATGVFVDRYQSLPAAVQLAYIDPRTDAQRAEQEALRRGVIAEIEALGLDDLLTKVDENLFGAAIDERLPADLQQRMGRMLELGTPLAVFVVPPGTPDP